MPKATPSARPLPTLCLLLLLAPISCKGDYTIGVLTPTNGVSASPQPTPSETVAALWTAADSETPSPAGSSSPTSPAATASPPSPTPSLPSATPSISSATPSSTASRSPITPAPSPFVGSPTPTGHLVSLTSPTPPVAQPTASELDTPSPSEPTFDDAPTPSALPMAPGPNLSPAHGVTPTPSLSPSPTVTAQRTLSPSATPSVTSSHPLDADGDGWTDLDCDDEAPSIYPGRPACPWIRPASSCREILEAGSALGSGWYQFSSDGIPGPTVYCDMETEGGGWTLIAHLRAGARTPSSIYSEERFFTQSWSQGEDGFTLAPPQLLVGEHAYGMLDARALLAGAASLRYSCVDESRERSVDAIWPLDSEDVHALIHTLTYAETPVAIDLSLGGVPFEGSLAYPTATSDAAYGCWQICGGCEPVTGPEHFTLGLCHNGPHTFDDDVQGVAQVAIGYHEGFLGLRLECGADTPGDTPLIDGTWSAWTR